MYTIYLPDFEIFMHCVISLMSLTLNVFTQKGRFICKLKGGIVSFILEQ